MKKEEQKQKLREITEKEAERERESLIIDFDEVLKEEQERAITIKWDGKVYQCPDRLPTFLKLKVLHNDGEIAIDDHESIFRKLFGDDFADRFESESETNKWFNEQMVAEKLMQPLFEHWFGFKFKDLPKKKVAEKQKK